MAEHGEVHPALRSVIDEYIGKGHRLKESSRTEATLEQPLHWWHIPMMLGSLILATMSGGGGEPVDLRKTVRLYVDDDGQVQRRSN